MGTRKAGSDTVDVEILGGVYSLKGGADAPAVRALAGELDARMRDLASAAPGADPLKVAILTALRLADEAREQREIGEMREAEIAERIGACADRLAGLLGAERAGTDH